MTREFHSFRTPGRIVFGSGAIGQVGGIARAYGRTALIVSGRRSARASGALAVLQDGLATAGVNSVLCEEVGHEPTVELVDKVRRLVDRHDCEVIVALGGGSVIDTATGAAGLRASSSPTVTHLRGELDVPDGALPWIAVPTTAGAGAEATPNAVVIDREARVKKSLRSWSWMARAAVVDPKLTLACPRSVTVRSGLDAFVQAVESYTSRWATPLTESVSFEGALRIAKRLPQAVADGSDLIAREAVAWGATMAGIALANARLGAVHGLAHSAAMACGLSHGETCAILLPSVIECNMNAAGAKYARLARALGAADAGASDSVAATAFLDFVRNLNRQLGIPRVLGEVGLTTAAIPEIVQESLPSGSLEANPRPAGAEELTTLLRNHLVV